MARLLWALTCQRVIVDRETNTVSYIDAVEGFAVSQFPIPFLPICVATLWRREEPRDSLQVRIRIQAPNGKMLQSYEPKEPIPLPKKRHRLNVFLGGMEIKEPGEYKIIVAQRKAERWRRECVLPIDISQLVPDRPQKGRRSRAKRAI